MRYLLLNGDWFVFTFGWQYLQNKPHCTPVGETERHREQVEKPKVKPVVKKPTEFPIYSNRRWKGD